jgi:tetratricopeptide (TPR) repeat protein
MKSTKGICRFSCVLLAFAIGSVTSVWAQSSETIGLNNDGVKALNSKNYELAIQLFEKALQNSPDYGLAKANLAITYNMLGSSKEKYNPKTALKDFHTSLFIDPSNSFTRTKLDELIRSSLKMDPRSFDSRLSLAKTAEEEHDFIGAAVEYQEALGIKEDASVHAKLSAIYKSLNKTDEAEAEARRAVSK